MVLVTFFTIKSVYFSQALPTTGSYERALRGELKNFTGISDVYEEPEHAEIVIETEKLSIEESAQVITNYIKKHYMK